MAHKLFFLVAGLFLLVCGSSIDAQNCENGAHTLIDEKKRSTLHRYNYDTDVALCDDNLDEDVWYRFVSYVGGTIPEKEPGDYVPGDQCGTENPIFITGYHHNIIEVGETRSVPVCVNYDADRTCEPLNDIQIHRCPTFYLYRLTRPPGCPAAYCAGELPPCDSGHIWNGLDCTDHHPPMGGQPIFTGPFIKSDLEVTEYGDQIYFRCAVQYDSSMIIPGDKEDLYYYRMTFLFDGQRLESIGSRYSHLLPFERPGSDSVYADLDEVDLRGRLGMRISCEAAPFWADQLESGATLVSQNGFVATLKHATPSYDFYFRNGALQQIPFESTLPLTCHYCTSLNANCRGCRYDFNFDSSVATETCILRWTGGQSENLHVYVLPRQIPDFQLKTLTFRPFNQIVSNDEIRPLWDQYIIPPVTLRIWPDEWNYKVCSSLGDPRITTYDNLYYSQLMVGDFYLSKTDDGRMEVQVQQYACSGGCNCGVIVREGNSVIKVSYCENPNVPQIVRLLSQIPEDSSEIFRDSTGNSFSIRMPSGLRVEVQHFSVTYGVHIYVHLPAVYHSRTSLYSMCGDADGDSTNDLGRTDAERELFRVPAGDSYFGTQPQCRNNNPQKTDCSCYNTTVVDCSNADGRMSYLSPADEPVSSRWTSNVFCTEEPFAAAASFFSEDSDESDYILDPSDLYKTIPYDPTFGTNVSLTWPTPRNKTREQVEVFCRNFLENSPVYTECTDVVDEETLEYTLNSCILDVQIIDDWIDMSPYRNVFEQDCVVSLTLAANITEGEKFVPPPILDSVYSELCPNQCSGHGECMDATCICSTGFIGADCSIDESVPPVLTSIIRNGLCDVMQRPCAAIAVFGQGMTSSPTLKCRFLDRGTGVRTDTNGTFVTPCEVSCPVPETQTHRRRKSKSVETRNTAISTLDVSIASDGVLFSNNLEQVIYNSVCMQCDPNKVCSKKPDTCVIENYCYANQELKDDNTCRQCVPGKSQISWTDQSVTDDWSSCSRECDLGAHIRNTICSIDDTVVKTESKQCLETSCLDNLEEKTEGVIISLSNDDVTRILLNPNGILNEVAFAVNGYCNQHPTKCCNSLGVPDGISLPAFTSEELCSYASGYPLVVDGIDGTVKVIVKINPDDIQRQCIQSTNKSLKQKSDAASLTFADVQIIYDAVSEAKGQMEKVLSVTINSVSKPYSDIGATASSCITSFLLPITMCLFAIKTIID